ncbi:major capsid protein [Peromfec virus RodF7_13]|uniref:Major capsid protein n=1 Tax=Peromfec virus RodF7_13 TaxID=2929348 RepID=A0A976R8U6_9VIRU|nr:major capsid protein [Peromfec virus RodF7_13]
MNRNTNSHFAYNPTNLDISRSKFVRPSTHKTTMNTGDLVPIYVDEILPGDTAIMDMSTIIRMATPIFPVMDNAYADFYYFFVPNRLVWDHFKEFMGENSTTFWEQKTEYEIPQVTSPTGGWEKGTIADYMGIPTKIENLSISSLWFRAYGLIYNEWFRDENLIQPVMINTDETTQTGSNGTNPITDVQNGGMPCKVAKYADYFTTALPEPQKGPDILIPLGQTAPVYGNGSPMYLTGTDKNDAIGLRALPRLATGEATGSNYRMLAYDNQNNVAAELGLIEKGKDHTPNIYADLSEATGATINQLRQSFAVQRMYEKDARGGTRYTEIIRTHFGTISPDARLQRPEYLGGMRVPININQVIQTSATNDVTPQGNTAAYSLTSHREHSFTKSFTEHGMIIGLCCIRTDHTYQQGLERMFSRKKRFDYYWPSFANLGEQAILNKEIYAQGTNADEEAFGYQEAWGEYRYKPSRVSGAFRSNYAQTLDAWHYADYYKEQPILSSGWIQETRENMNRTIAVSDELEDQFIADFYFKNTMIRPMPVYSIPGLIDHH